MQSHPTPKGSTPSLIFGVPKAGWSLSPDAEDTCLASDRTRGTGGFSWPTCPSITTRWAPRALYHRAALQAPGAAPRTRRGLSNQDPCVRTPGASKPPRQPHGVLRTCQNAADFCFPAWGQLYVLSAGFQLPGLSFHLSSSSGPKMMILKSYSCHGGSDILLSLLPS